MSPAFALPPVVDVGLHAEEVDDPVQVVLLAHRQLRRDDLRPEGRLQGGDGGREVGALAVEHVAEQHAGQTTVGGAAPQALGLDFDPEHRVDDHERGLDDLERGDGVGEKARVARRIDEVEREAGPVDVGEAGREAQLALLLVVVPVGHGRAVGDAAQTRHHAGVVQQRLEQRRLARAAMADEGDVPDLAWVVHPGSPRFVLATGRAKAGAGGRSRPFGRVKSSTAGRASTPSAAVLSVAWRGRQRGRGPRSRTSRAPCRRPRPGRSRASPRRG